MNISVKSCELTCPPLSSKNCDFRQEYSICVKEIVDENFQDYKKASMMIATTKCDFKCLYELGLKPEICQNMDIISKPTLHIKDSDILKRYSINPITKAVVIGGLEPMLQFREVYGLISHFRENKCYDDFVIYTGYYRHEIQNKILCLSTLGNIVVKYGRFVPNSTEIFDEVLGVYLSSDNQYAERIC